MAQNRKCFVPECYVDTSLTEYLLGIKGVNHQTGCNNVAKTMRCDKLKDSFAVGLIDHDKDKRIPKYFTEEFKEIASTSHIVLKKHKKISQYVFITGEKEWKAIDKFILDCANELNVDPTTYNLGKDPKAFRKDCKQVKTLNDSRFKQLFAAIKDAKEMKALRRTLKYLNQYGYTADINEIKKLFRE